MAVACEWLLAAAAYPALRLPTRRRGAALAAVAVLVLLAPLLVRPQAHLPRMICAVLAVTVTVKLYDLHVGASAGHLPRFGEFIVFLGNIFSLVQRRSPDLPERPMREELRTIVRAVAMLLPSVALAVLVFRLDWTRYPFALEHAVKVVAFFLVLVPLTSVGGAAWRVAGGRAVDFMNNPFAARTPADFWRRYNQPTHEFLQYNVFAPLAASTSSRRRFDRANTWRAGLATFALSAAVHEYVFTVPVGRLQGYQTVFFLVQGLAVAATLRVKPRGWKVVPWVIGTFVFNLATGVLFFASLHHVVPIYQHRPPLWDERGLQLPHLQGWRRVAVRLGVHVEPRLPQERRTVEQAERIKPVLGRQLRQVPHALVGDEPDDAGIEVQLGEALDVRPGSRDEATHLVAPAVRPDAQVEEVARPEQAQPAPLESRLLVEFDPAPGGVAEEQLSLRGRCAECHGEAAVRDVEMSTRKHRQPSQPGAAARRTAAPPNRLSARHGGQMPRVPIYCSPPGHTQFT